MSLSCCRGRRRRTLALIAIALVVATQSASADAAANTLMTGETGELQRELMALGVTEEEEASIDLQSAILGITPREKASLKEVKATKPAIETADNTGRTSAAEMEEPTTKKTRTRAPKVREGSPYTPKPETTESFMSSSSVLSSTSSSKTMDEDETSPPSPSKTRKPAKTRATETSSSNEMESTKKPKKSGATDAEDTLSPSEPVTIKPLRAKRSRDNELTSPDSTSSSSLSTETPSLTDTAPLKPKKKTPTQTTEGSSSSDASISTTSEPGKQSAPKKTSSSSTVTPPEATTSVAYASASNDTSSVSLNGLAQSSQDGNAHVSAPNLENEASVTNVGALNDANSKASDKGSKMGAGMTAVLALGGVAVVAIGAVVYLRTRKLEDENAMGKKGDYGGSNYYAQNHRGGSRGSRGSGGGGGSGSGAHDFPHANVPQHLIPKNRPRQPSNNVVVDLRRSSLATPREEPVICPIVIDDGEYVYDDDGSVVEEDFRRTGPQVSPGTPRESSLDSGFSDDDDFELEDQSFHQPSGNRQKSRHATMEASL